MIAGFAKEAQQENACFGTIWRKSPSGRSKPRKWKIISIGDRESFRAAVQPVWERYGKQHAELIERIEAVK